MSASSASTPPAIAEALARAGEADDAGHPTAELAEVDAEIERLVQAIDNLVEQRRALEEYRAGIVGRTAALARRVDEQRHHSLYAALEAQAAAVHTRGAALAAPGRLELDPPFAPGLAKLVSDLQSAEQRLDALPEHEQASARQHHDELRAKIVAMLRDRAEPPGFEGVELTVDVALCIDPPRGAPELLVLLLPVRAEVDDPEAATDTLPTWLAARVGKAVFDTASAVGSPAIDVRSGPALGRDLLDIEVDLAGMPETFLPELRRRLAEQLATAPELQSAKLQARVTDVPPSIVFPAEVSDE